MNQTPEEKAKELISSYRFALSIPNAPLGEYKDSVAVQCALIAVDEILNSSPLNPNFADWDDCGGEHRYWYDAQKTQALHFWQKVKEEIEKL